MHLPDDEKHVIELLDVHAPVRQRQSCIGAAAAVAAGADDTAA